MARKTWFITGISSGFGYEMARQLLKRGDTVAGTVRQLDSVQDLKAGYTDRLWLAVLDLTDGSAITPVVDRAFAELGTIDVIVNNAGYGLFGAAESLTDEQVRHQIDTNLIGPIQVTRAAIPYLRAQGGGHILAISTYGGQATHPGASLYHASKWGMEGFFESLGKELAPFNITVTIAEPGGARTNFRRAAGMHMAPVEEAYKDTPIAGMRSRLSDPNFVASGDPVKMVTLMIACIDERPVPKRLVLGSDSYAILQQALTERLALVEAQKEVALSTDFPNL